MSGHDTRFVVVTAHAWLNECGSGADYRSTFIAHRSARIAGKAGVLAFDHDDFLIAKLNSREQIVAVTTAHDEPLTDWASEDYAAVAESLGLDLALTEEIR